MALGYHWAIRRSSLAVIVTWRHGCRLVAGYMVGTGNRSIRCHGRYHVTNTAAIITVATQARLSNTAGGRLRYGHCIWTLIRISRSYCRLMVAGIMEYHYVIIVKAISLVAAGWGNYVTRRHWRARRYWHFIGDITALILARGVTLSIAIHIIETLVNTIITAY